MKASLKVLTYNIHRGLSTFRKIDVLHAIVGLLDASEADIVFLQEVWQHHGISEHQLEALCDQSWEYRLFQKNAVFPEGAQGNVILSRLPVLSSVNVDITVAALEPRGFLHARVELPGTHATMALICVHLGLCQYERLEQLKTLSHYIATKIEPACPLIVAGDFNDWRGRNVRAYARAVNLEEAVETRHGKFGKTYPSFAPMLPLDRIYFRKCQLKTARVVQDMTIKGLSDHLPVEAIFRLPPNASY
jgi:endonuclease/exonuclease/phosphatase family metal-dependent hydrolase